MPRAKIAPGSLLDADAQAERYRAEMGAEAHARQERAARLERGLCVCTPAKVRRKWAGETAPRVRTVHAADCPKHEPWMHAD